MPHDWLQKERRYRVGGKLLTRLQVRAEIDKLTAFVTKEAGLLAERLGSGAINLTQFEIEMRELLKAGHIIAASVGRGGRMRMTQSDWGRVGAKIKWQYEFLAKFVRKIETGKITKILSVNRAKSYASAIYISFANAWQVTQTEIIAGGGERNPADVMLCRLVQNSEEGCDECGADADEGWIPVTEMKEIGERICGDFCRCFLEFEDEV